MIDVGPRLPSWRSARLRPRRYIAPHLGLSTVGTGNFSESNLPQLNILSAVPEKATWPTDDQAKVQLFGLSKWDISKHGNGSKVIINRCIRIAGTEIACELAAHLKWIEGETRIEERRRLDDDSGKESVIAFLVCFTIVIVGLLPECSGAS